MQCFSHYHYYLIDNVQVAARTLNGKHIKINDAFLYETITGKKTTTYEIGHTGGLSHPSFDPSQLMQIPNQNFMKQGELSHPTGPTKE